MSESTTPPIESGGLPETGPGPTPDTSAPVQTSPSPEPAPLLETVATETTPEVVVEAPVAEVTEPAKPTSIMSEAKGEVPEPAKESVAEEPKKVEAKEPETKEEVKEPEPAPPPEPLAPPVYDKFVVPDDVSLADDKVGTFTGLLGEYENKVITDPTQAHSAFQELGQKMVDFYVAEVKETTERAARLQREVWDRTIEGWQTSFRDDPEIGKNRQDTTLQRIGGLFSLYGQQTSPERETAVRDAYGLTGAGNHPEVIRFVNWAASRLVETPRIVTPVMPRAPVNGTLSRAQRLYRNSTGAA